MDETNHVREKKKICLAIHSLGIGGMERVMAQLAADFSSRGNTEVHLVLFGRNREIQYPISDTIIIHRPKFLFNNKKRGWLTLRTLIFLRREIRRINPDTVLCFGERWNNLLLLALFKTGYPVYISDRSRPNDNLGKVHNLLRNKLYPSASGFIAQTEKAATVVEEKKWNKNWMVIGNPIREIVADPEAMRQNSILFVGRLIKSKHVDRLIQMFHEVRQPGWELKIVGGDAKKLTLSQEYQQLIHDLKANEYIFLEGARKNVEEYYTRSKIFAFPSSSEGFPNVIGEALSAGIPVIAYDCVAGPSDMIEDGKNGYLIPLFNEEQFKEKLRLLMEDEVLRQQMGSYAPNSIRKFAADEVADKFYSFILS